MSKNLAIASVFCAAALGLFGCGTSPKETVTLETISAVHVNGAVTEPFTGALRVEGKTANGETFTCLARPMYGVSAEKVEAARVNTMKNKPADFDKAFCWRPVKFLQMVNN